MLSIDTRTLPPQAPLAVAAANQYSDTTLAWARELDPSLIIARNVAYGTDAAHHYDVFGRPSTTLQPAVVFFHGGGWTHGYKEWSAFMAEPLARLGLRLVTPDYRLAPEHRLPAAYEDGLAALRHLSIHAQDYGIDPQRLYLSGHSAGGHLALLTALRRADARAAGISEHAIRACLPISGIHELHHPQPAPGSLEEAVYTKVLHRPRDDAAMSPLCWGAANPMPVLLSYGKQDTDRVRLSNQRMAALLALQPGSVQLHEEPGLDHFATHTQLHDPAAPWYLRLAQLLQAG